MQRYAPVIFRHAEKTVQELKDQNRAQVIDLQSWTANVTLAVICGKIIIFIHISILIRYSLFDISTESTNLHQHYYYK